jgi:hypothetical protein
MLIEMMRSAAMAGWSALFLVVAAATTEVKAETCPKRDGRAVARDDFHLYLLMGQSNMAGRGKMTEEDRQPIEGVYALNADGAWSPAAHPLHFDKPRVAGVGLSLDFAKAMRRSDPDATIGLIPCAVGGTRLDQWKKGQALYDNAVARAKVASRCGVLRGILWHQGEGDSAENLASTYAARLSAMLADLRTDLGQGDLAIVVGELGHFRKHPGTLVINDQLHEVAQRLPRVAWTSAAGLGHNGDSTHFDASSLKKFGRRYAEKMLECQSRDDSSR